MLFIGQYILCIGALEEEYKHCRYGMHWRENFTLQEQTTGRSVNTPVFFFSSSSVKRICHVNVKMEMVMTHEVFIACILSTLCRRLNS